MKAPEQHELSEIISIEVARLEAVKQCILQSVMEETVDHAGSASSTNHDNTGLRVSSRLHKSPLLYLAGSEEPVDENTVVGFIKSKILQPPAEIRNTVREVYRAILKPAEQYFEMPLSLIQSDHAAVAHVYYPGDSYGESHHDVAPTVAWYLDCPEGYGALWIAKEPGIFGIENICNKKNSWRLQPRPQTFQLFRGDMLSHVVEGIPEGVEGVRIGVNFAFQPLIPTKDPVNYRGHARAYLLDHTEAA